MARNRSILLMARGMRVHRFFREMALDLAKDHRVMVLATPEEFDLFSSVPGIEVRCYSTPDLVFGPGRKRLRVPSDLRGSVSEIERKISLPLYKAASNYLLFGRLVKESGGCWDYLTTEEEILAAYVGSFRELSEIFERFAPDVVFFEGMDVISSYVAFGLAYRYGVFPLEPRFSPLGQGRISFGFGIYRRNVVMEYLYTHRQLLSNASRSEAERLIQSIPQQFEESAYFAVHRNMIYGNSPLNPRRIPDLLSDRGRAFHALRDIRRHYFSVRNRYWLERRLTRAIPEPPYLVFPLQHAPEAGICSQCPRWVRQDAVIEQLAINAPSYLRIVTKEHPRAFGSRGEAFFGPLTAIPNVVVCHPAVNTTALLSGAEAVVAVTGTPGFEAILLGKHVGVLGRPFYSIYKGVKMLNYPEDIYSALNDESWKPEEMIEERRDFLAAYVQSLYEFGHGEGTKIYPVSGGEKWAHALRETMNFIDTHKLKPSDFDAGL